MPPWLSVDELQQIVDRHKASLEIYAAQWSESPDDCVQEAFVQLIRQSERPQQLPSWLFRVVRNFALSSVRSENRRRAREQCSAQLRSRLDNFASPLDTAVLAEALSDLDECQRQAVIAKVWGGLTLQEIADLLQVSVSSAHRYFEQALTNLRSRLGTPCLK